MWLEHRSTVLVASLCLGIVLCFGSVVLLMGENPTPQTASNEERRLPRAIIIGVKKGGTRALLEYLRLHPDVRAPGPEIHFFDRYFSRGFEWYRKQMPSTSPTQMTLEKTPSYFIKREVPPRIFELSPATKLLVVLRDPVTRAISDYTQSFSKGRTDRNFEEMVFLNSDKRVIDQKWNAVRIGLYAKHLKKWLPYFSLDQMHFVSGENLILDPVGEMKAVERFLGLPSYISEDDFNFNQTKGFPCVRRRPSDTEFKCLGKTKGRTHPHVSEEILSELKEFFRPHNEVLFELVGRDFGWNDS